jgi:nucleoside-diphosphate-sugar epimerase
MRLLIAGCGDLGTRLGLLWRQGGGEVLALRRRPSLLPETFAGVEADLARPLPAGLLSGRFTALAYVASADQRGPAAYRQAYVDGLRNVLDALPELPPRIVFASSTAVYGEDEGGWVDESTATAPQAFNGELLCEAERLLGERAPAATAARLSGLYGPGRERMWQRACSGDVGSPRWGNRIHVDDAAAALLHVLRLPAAPPLLCVSDDRPARENEVLAAMRRMAGLPPAASTAAPPVAAARGLGRRVSNRRLRASGFRLSYPDYLAGYAALRQAEPAPAALL